jgi:exosortase
MLVAYIPTISWMVNRWVEPESYYGHGFLIPFVSLFFLWQRRGTLKKIAFSSFSPGLWIVAAGLTIHTVCVVLDVDFISGFSFVFVLYGLVLFFFGKQMARNLFFPIFFLLAMIPLPLVLLSNVTIKLKLFAAQCATFILNEIGFPSIREGNIIRMPHSFIAIEAPCSGLRSLISLLTLGALFAYAIKMSYPRKGALFLSSVPLAVVSNVMRIIILATVNDLYGEKVAMGFIHDFTGFLVFAIAFTGLFGVSKVLEKRA